MVLAVQGVCTIHHTQGVGDTSHRRHRRWILGDDIPRDRDTTNGNVVSTGVWYVQRALPLLHYYGIGCSGCSATAIHRCYHRMDGYLELSLSGDGQIPDR